jgi:hypothetical protein
MRARDLETIDLTSALDVVRGHHSIYLDTVKLESSPFDGEVSGTILDLVLDTTHGISSEVLDICPSVTAVDRLQCTRAMTTSVEEYTVSLFVREAHDAVVVAMRVVKTQAIVQTSSIVVVSMVANRLHFVGLASSSDVFGVHETIYLDLVEVHSSPVTQDTFRLAM